MKNKTATSIIDSPFYNINLISRNYKDQNGYNGRGNYNSALFYGEVLNQFKIAVLDKFINRDHDSILIREVFNHLQINHLESSLLKVQQLGYLNVWFPQLLRHRGASVFSRDHDIIYTRDPKEATQGDLVTNGISYSAIHNIPFFPKYYGKMYRQRTTQFHEKKTIGLYLRSDVAINQVVKLMDYLIYHKLNENYNILCMGSIDTLGGYRALKGARFTTDEREFIEGIDIYMYTYMEKPDTVNNTLYNCILNKKRIIYIEPEHDQSDYELNDYVSIDLKLIFKKGIYFTPSNKFDIDTLNSISDRQLIENSSIVIYLIKGSVIYFIREIMTRLNKELFIFNEEQLEKVLTNLDYNIWHNSISYNVHYWYDYEETINQYCVQSLVNYKKYLER